MSNLLCINSPFTNPYLNLAAEEYLLKNFDTDIFLLYINKPSVIIGKHQNAMAEINIKDIIQRKIPVVRRLSGGGTVYHDLGNLNFAWIVQAEKNKSVNFSKYMNDIYLFLKSLNINVVQNANNDLAIEGRKISGNAEHLFKNRLIHHGTLLYNSNLEDLNKAIASNFNHYSSKAVSSKRTKVTNIIDFMPQPVAIHAFRNALFHFIKTNNSQSTDYQLNEKDIVHINNLVSNKYSTQEWNFSYSPKYVFEKELTIRNEAINIQFKVQKGIISDFKLTAECFTKDELLNFSYAVNGTKHHPNNIETLLNKPVFVWFRKKMGLDNLDELFF